MKRKVLWFLESIYPPIAAWRANSQLQKRMAKQLEDYQASIDKWLEIIGEKVSDPLLVGETESIERAETQRKEAIEAKASSLTAALGISITLLVLVPAIMGKGWGLPIPVAWVVALTLILAVVHFLVAAYYALRVSKVAAFFVTSTETMKTLLKKQDDQMDQARILATKLANTEMNIPTLIVKTNCLAVAQTLFLRGIIFFGVGASIALISKVISG